MTLRNRPDGKSPDSKDPTLTDVRRAGMNLLARREHSRAELCRKLEVREFPKDLIHTVLSDLETDGLQNDERFAEVFAGSRVQRGQGPIRIRAELKERGVNDVIVATCLKELNIDWCDLAATVRAKRFGQTPPTDYKERARQSRFLSYRGFDGEQTRAALDASSNVS